MPCGPGTPCTPAAPTGPCGPIMEVYGAPLNETSTDEAVPQRMVVPVAGVRHGPAVEGVRKEIELPFWAAAKAVNAMTIISSFFIIVVSLHCSGSHRFAGRCSSWLR